MEKKKVWIKLWRVLPSSPADDEAFLKKALRENQHDKVFCERLKLAYMIHELRAPLMAASSQLDALRQQLRQESGPRYEGRLTLIFYELQRTTAFMAQLTRLFSRQHDPLYFRLGRLGWLSCRMLRGYVLHQQTSLRLVMPYNQLRLYGDARRIQQAIINLIVNSIQACDPQGAVRVRIRRKSSWLSVYISDNGPGVPEDQQALLFEPYFTTKKDGLGLGLSDSRALAREYGGDLLYRPLAPGSLFILILPLRGNEIRAVGASEIRLTGE